MSDKPEKDDASWSAARLLGTFAAVVVVTMAAFGGWALVLLNGWTLPELKHQASFGDAMGPAAGLISSLALAAAVVSVLMQRDELRAQRTELRESRKVMAAQEEAQRRLSAAQEAANKLAERHLQLSYVASRISPTKQWEAAFGKRWAQAREITLGCVDRDEGLLNVDPLVHYERLREQGLLDAETTAQTKTAVLLIEFEFNLAHEAGWILAPEEAMVLDEVDEQLNRK